MFQITSRLILNKLKTFNLIKVMSTENVPLKKIKYKSNTKKRKWEERRSDKGEGLNLLKQVCLEGPIDRIKRRKYAILLGYSGTNHFGMQRNPFAKTIEEDLFQAMLKADVITQEAFNQIQTIQFQRAARTDKGVSATRQVISMKLPEEVDVEKINSYLPEVIRIFGIKRVTKGFNSKSQCDGRTYTYTLPTIAFAKHDEKVDQSSFRLSNETLSAINDFLKLFLGTKNYHNFTSKRKANDPSCNRYIMSFECEQPFIRKDVEFTVVKVRGQSFMLHQIRKMVGLTLAVIRGHTSSQTLSEAFTTDRVNVPVAPGLGLVLDQVHYTRYDYRYGQDGIHETLEWKECDDKVKDFKEKFINPIIIDAEMNERSMLTWLETKLAIHSYDFKDELKDDPEGNRELENADEESDTEEINDNLNESVK